MAQTIISSNQSVSTSRFPTVPSGTKSNRVRNAQFPIRITHFRLSSRTVLQGGRQHGSEDLTLSNGSDCFFGAYSFLRIAVLRRWSLEHSLI